MKRYPLSFRLPFFAILSLFVVGISAQDDRPIWEQEALLVYSESSGDFNRLRSFGSVNQRLSLYTQAHDILHGQVEVEEGHHAYQDARRLFRMLVADRDDDAIGLASAYYLARIAQSNPFEKDISEAKQLYWDLYDAWPDRFFGQMAFAKYVTLEVYDDTSMFSAEERIQKLEPIVPSISLPNIRQSVHRILGESYLRFELDPEPAYKHFQSAYDIGVPVESMRVQVLERIAELGSQLGMTERALRAYEEILLIDPYNEHAEAYRKEASRLRTKLVEDRAALE